MDERSSVRDTRVHAIVLSAILAAFLFRVLAQLAQAIAPTSVLPPFSAWQSGLLPYPVLVASQIAILIVLSWATTAAWRGGARRRPIAARILGWAGGAYLFFSVIRFGLGFGIASGSPFLAAHLPAFFHIVLALGVLAIADLLSSERGAAVKWAIRYFAYPVILCGALALLWLLLRNGASLSWAPFATVAVAGGLVVAAERVSPFLPAWRPLWREHADDALYLAVVQVGAPLLFGWAVTLGLFAAVNQTGLFIGVWPTHWPLLAQLALKIAAGDFLRYWLHRAAHQTPLLWRLHAVHHQPEKLYTTSVFRFHPLEKGLQYLCDTLPFLLLGIGVDVLAYYFVFYAVSGLFQHANIDIRLGYLNYLVSGPEVHRWHHSKTIAESNNNYAHSFVVWDVLFGTYYRPRDRAVSALGLLERDYPRRFAGQMLAPFRKRGTA